MAIFNSYVSHNQRVTMCNLGEDYHLDAEAASFLKEAGGFWALDWQNYVPSNGSPG